MARLSPLASVCGENPWGAAAAEENTNPGKATHRRRSGKRRQKVSYPAVRIVGALSSSRLTSDWTMRSIASTLERPYSLRFAVYKASLDDPAGNSHTMSRRKGRSASKRNKGKVGKGVVSAQAAAEHLKSARFRDAIASYKQLLKQDQRAEWVDALADAYLGRAEQLVARGMTAEAVAIWQNRAQICQRPLADPRYLEWLLALGRTQEALRLYRQHAHALADETDFQRVRARIATALLAHGETEPQELAPDDALRRDLPAANQALGAYARGDDEACETALRGIPFRSPYRDFRQLMTVLVRRESDPETALGVMARVSADTPFAGLRVALELSESRHAPGWTTVSSLRTEAVPLVAALCGWQTKQIRAMHALKQLGPEPNTAALVDFILTHRALLGQDFACDAALSIAASNPQLYERVLRAFRNIAEEKLWPKIARIAEQHDQTILARQRWREFEQMLARGPDDADNRLRRALIHRHLAALSLDTTLRPPFGHTQVEHLEQSLALDPHDRTTVLQLIDHYLHRRHLKQARRWVKHAQTHHPDDAQCLLRAIETALAGNAYKKAAALAERLLKIDPINQQVHALLVDAYLSHARKKIKAHQPVLAARELDSAAQWAREPVHQGRELILRGLMQVADNQQTAIEYLRRGMERAGGGLVGRFYFLLEAQHLQRHLETVSKRARLPALKALGQAEEVLRLARTLGAMREHEGKSIIGEVLAFLGPAIDAPAASKRIGREEIELICETMLRYGAYASLKRYANAGLRRWPACALFLFYRAEARLESETALPWTREFEALEQALAKASEQGDRRTAERIRMELERWTPSFAPSADDPFDPFDEWLDDEPDVGDISPDAMESLNDIAEVLTAEEFTRLLGALMRDETPPVDIMEKLNAKLGPVPQSAAPLPFAGQSASRTPRGQRKRRAKKPSSWHEPDLFEDFE